MGFLLFFVGVAIRYLLDLNPQPSSCSISRSDVKFDPRGDPSKVEKSSARPILRPVSVSVHSQRNQQVNVSVHSNRNMCQVDIFSAILRHFAPLSLDRDRDTLTLAT